MQVDLARSGWENISLLDVDHCRSIGCLIGGCWPKLTFQYISLDWDHLLQLLRGDLTRLKTPSIFFKCQKKNKCTGWAATSVDFKPTNQSTNHCIDQRFPSRAKPMKAHLGSAAVDAQKSRKHLGGTKKWRSNTTSGESYSKYPPEN